MVFVISDIHVALVVHSDTPGGIQFARTTAQAAPTAQKAPIGRKFAHLVAAPVGHEQSVVDIDGDARGAVGFAVAALHGVPAGQEVALCVEDGHSVQPFVGHVHVPLRIDDQTRWPDQLAWRTAVPAELRQVLFFARLAPRETLLTRWPTPVRSHGTLLMLSLPPLATYTTPSASRARATGLLNPMPVCAPRPTLWL